MAVTSTTLALIAAGVGTATAAYGSVEQRRAGDKARRAGRAREALARKRESLELARQRRQQIREARVATAQIEAGAAATGTARTSSAAQGAGSIRTRAASNISFLNQTEGISQAQSIFSVDIGRATGKANQAAAISQLGGQLFSAGVSAGGLDIFAKSSTPKPGLSPNRPDPTIR